MKKHPVWGGTEETIDGVTNVKNPLEPMYGAEAVFFEEELTIGEVEGREEYMFQSLLALDVNDNGDIFGDSISWRINI